MKDFVEFITLAILLVIFGFIIEPLILMFAWNAVMPMVFGLPTLTFGNSLMIDIVATILFKSRITTNNKD